MPEKYNEVLYTSGRKGVMESIVVHLGLAKAACMWLLVIAGLALER